MKSSGMNAAGGEVRYPCGNRNPKGSSASIVWRVSLPSAPTLTTSQPGSANSQIFCRHPPQGQIRPGSDEVTQTRRIVVAPCVTAAEMALASAQTPSG